MKVFKVLTRIFLHPSKMEKTIKFYEDIFNESCSMRFDYKAMKLELAMVSSVLLLAGKSENLRKFEDTRLTFLVDSLDDYFNHFMKKGIDILEEPKEVPTGKNMRVKHPDGTIVEYVEHNK
jgi:predicted enzyme related to lactoylglutathione lyase